MVQIRSPISTPKVEQKKQEILEAASAVFRRRGLHATGMRDIASELDMHAGNIYYYFRDKQELLAFCQQQALSSLLELVSEIAASDLTPPQKLRRLVIGHVLCLNESTPGSLAHLEVEALDAPWRRRLQTQRDRYEQAIHEILLDGTRRGEFRDVDTQTAGRALLGALNWTVKWYRSGGGMTAEEIGDQFADLFLGGLAIEQEEARA